MNEIKPILAILVDNNITVETDLTDEEKDIIKRGRKEYENGNFVSLDSLCLLPYRLLWLLFFQANTHSWDAAAAHLY